MTSTSVNASVYHGNTRYEGMPRKTLTVGTSKLVEVGMGYDMVGSLFGQWLNSNYEDKLTKLAQDNAHKMTSPGYFGSETDFYGLYAILGDNGEVVKGYVNGMCGLSCVRRLARMVGVHIIADWARDTNRRDGYVIITN